MGEEVAVWEKHSPAEARRTQSARMNPMLARYNRERVRMEESQAPATSPPPDHSQSAAPMPALGALSLLRDIAISVVLAVILIVFIYQPVKVEGTSMMPGLTDQERIFINKYEYRLGVGAIARGDLVVFNYPYDPTQSYIKRVIGLPGDQIRIDS